MRYGNIRGHGSGHCYVYGLGKYNILHAAWEQSSRAKFNKAAPAKGMARATAFFPVATRQTNMNMDTVSRKKQSNSMPPRRYTCAGASSICLNAHAYQNAAGNCNIHISSKSNTSSPAGGRKEDA
ncbi:MAG TPA: hypothetical protein GXZ52_08010 [Clostridiales bacterium]|nr:hypothetical protein [Clostridiales bacterium]